MKELSYTLLTDGGSDKVLLNILTWLLKENQVKCAIQGAWANIGQLPKSNKLKLPDKIKCALDIAPCDLLFIHRDAEKEPRENRVIEISKALEEVKKSVKVPVVHVCVIPVQMTEAWLLFDEVALRTAADNPSGKKPLNLPAMAKLEQLHTKNVLHGLLQEASEKKGRKLKQFSVHAGVHRLAELIDDFSPLRALSAFQALEAEIQEVINTNGWGFELEEN